MNAEELYSLPGDEVKQELQGGYLVSEPLPGSRHGRVAAAVADELRTHVKKHRLGVVFAGDTGFVLARSPDTVRGPDVSFVTRERFEQVGESAKAFPGPPDLAIEILSPSNTPASMHAKVADYLAAGARRVWVVDSETRTVAVYATLLAPRILAPTDFLVGEDVVPGFRVRVADLFEI
jgi:Uma2 family endonuclease